MGQQQLLLIILGVIIVGIAVAVGINMFTGGARDANRDAVINDLVNLAAKAQQFYRRPQSLGGGENSFGGFKLNASDTGNANGSYSVTDTEPADADYVAGDTTRVGTLGSALGTIFIVGCGKEIGNDGVNQVKAFIRVSATAQPSAVLN